jgi:hypothetical protein
VTEEEYYNYQERDEKFQAKVRKGEYFWNGETYEEIPEDEDNLEKEIENIIDYEDIYEEDEDSEENGKDKEEIKDKNRKESEGISENKDGKEIKDKDLEENEKIEKDNEVEVGSTKNKNNEKESTKSINTGVFGVSSSS